MKKTMNRSFDMREKKSIKKQIIIFLIAITIICLFTSLWYYLFYYSSFSVEDYTFDIKWCSRYENMLEYTNPIDSKKSAIAAAEMAWKESNESYYDVGKCVYFVSYDETNDCWLVEGHSLDRFCPVINAHGGVIGGVKRAIILSDGKVLAIMLDT